MTSRSGAELFRTLAAAGAVVALLLMGSCTPITKLLVQGGEKQATPVPHPPAPPGPHLLIFAFDGVGYNQLMTVIQSDKAPNLSGLLGRDQGGGLYEHAYSAPNAISILPSTTMAVWSSIFSGEPPAYTGVPGNEWFAREQMRFFAPAPVSIATPATH